MGELFKILNDFLKVEPSDALDKLISEKLLKASSDNLNDTLHEVDISIQEDDGPRWRYICHLINILLNIKKILNQNDQILLSVKNEKLLCKSFEFIVCFGVLPNLLKGVGMPLEKRSEFGKYIKPVEIESMRKYLYLKCCVNFFTKMYETPIMKNIILNKHHADYLVSLMQISFAPLQKVKNNPECNLDETTYKLLLSEQNKYEALYQSLVNNSPQQIVMRDLLLLQSVKAPPPPLFLKRATSRELSRRLIVPGGLLNLMKCFDDASSFDSGINWQHIEMICKIISVRHGGLSECEYVENITEQLKKILFSKNPAFITMATSCLKSLIDSFPLNEIVISLCDYIIKEPFLISSDHMPNTLILTTEESLQRVDIIKTFFEESHNLLPVAMLSPIIYILFIMDLTIEQSTDMKRKLNYLIVKTLSESSPEQFCIDFKHLLFGIDNSNINMKFKVENLNHGIQMISTNEDFIHPSKLALQYMINLINENKQTSLPVKIFDFCLDMLISLSKKRLCSSNKDLLFLECNVSADEILDQVDEYYAILFNLLENLSINPSVIRSFKESPKNISEFIDFFLNQYLTNVSSNIPKISEDCFNIALIFLNTLLLEGCSFELTERCQSIANSLEKMCGTSNVISNSSKMLAKEALLIMRNKNTPNKKESKFEGVLSHICQNSIPLCAHGLMELTKLIESKDQETLSKKMYALCIFQEYLKHDDSYIYLSAINGLAALGSYCTEDVLECLCKEYLNSPSIDSSKTKNDFEIEQRNRMKVGDILVKVCRTIGELAVVHKVTLLNTVLVCCRDDDPLLRASAVSNLAELCRVLNYRLGSTVHEILLCIWDVVESDKSQECRRAAVMVAASLLKGLGKEMIVYLKDTMLPLYRSLKNVYKNESEDCTVRLHAQIALEELNEAVTDVLFPKLNFEKKIFLLEKPDSMI